MAVPFNQKVSQSSPAGAAAAAWGVGSRAGAGAGGVVVFVVMVAGALLAPPIGAAEPRALLLALAAVVLARAF